MAFEAIQRLQAEFTDKYVIVTAGRPDLARFEGVVGQVKTINMSGRALVEFTGYLNNPAWHDIELAALKVVDKPPEPPASNKSPATKKPASKVPAKAAAKGASAADVLAAVRGGAGKATPSAKKDAAGRTPKKASPSVGKATSDILAAARGGGTAPKSKPAAAKANKPSDKKTSPSVGKSTADILAAARGKAAASEPSPTEPAPKQPNPKKKAIGMTTEEILAAARAKKQPAEESPKPSALDELTAEGGKKTEPRRKLTAEDIRNIGAGKLSIRREQPVATEPLEEKPKPAAGDDAKPSALPEKIDHTKLTAADILALGGRK